MRERFRTRKRGKRGRKGPETQGWSDDAHQEKRRVNRKQLARKKAQLEQFDVEEELMDIESA